MDANVKGNNPSNTWREIEKLWRSVKWLAVVSFSKGKEEVNMLGPERWWTKLEGFEAEGNFGGRIKKC